MPEELAIPWLKRLHVAGAGLANNHGLDLGPSGLAETQAALSRAGIPFAAQGEALSLPGLDIVALSDLGTKASQEVDLLSPDLLDALLREGADRAVVAFVHWGREWITAPGPRETALAGEMTRRGVGLIAGAHPHKASKGLEAIAGGDTLLAYSLGNFLFDQTSTRGASSAMLELTVFPQGTVFTRRLPLPNLFELGRAE
jgi:poly-gamma-glutamate capsule biosynthesis protein CapA/YwtB (metallophosphatase superfamily)